MAGRRFMSPPGRDWTITHNAVIGEPSMALWGCDMRDDARVLADRARGCGPAGIFLTPAEARALANDLLAAVATVKG